jgi:hypothetical protein
VNRHRVVLEKFGYKIPRVVVNIVHIGRMCGRRLPSCVACGIGLFPCSEAFEASRCSRARTTFMKQPSSAMNLTFALGRTTEGTCTLATCRAF